MPATAATKMIPRIISPFVVRNFGGGSGPYTTFFSLLNLDVLKPMDTQSSVILLNCDEPLFIVLPPDECKPIRTLRDRDYHAYKKRHFPIRPPS